MLRHAAWRRPRSASARGNGVACFELMSLEPRLMMCADESITGPLPSNLVAFPPVHASAPATSPGSVQALPGQPLNTVPVLHSDSGAPATLYLDFTGDTTTSWGGYTPGTTPAYDQDGNPSTFSTGELDSIRQIWARVAEAYSPFNIDVTTVDPGNLNDNQAVKVVLGGDGHWFGPMVGGISYVGGFTNSLPNTVFVFTGNLAAGDSKYSGMAAAHEAGHAFGLQHQAVWSGGTLRDEYNPGNGSIAPLMGNSYNAARGVWWKGTTSVSATSIQDDLATLASATNGFGYRPDDSGNTPAGATALVLAGGSFNASGVIMQTSDVDYYSFTTTGGQLNLLANPAAVGPMLHLRLDLHASDGTLVASAASATLGQRISTTLTAGTYYVAVASYGAYGDVGQYSLSGSVGSQGQPNLPPQDTVPTAPSRLLATAIAPGRARLLWSHDGQNVQGFKVQRSTDGRKWSYIRTLGAKVRSLTDAGLRVGSLYYRIAAFNKTGQSPFCAAVRVRITPSRAKKVVRRIAARPAAVPLESSASRAFSQSSPFSVNPIPPRDDPFTQLN